MCTPYTETTNAGFRKKIFFLNETQALSFEVITLFQLFLAARSLLTSSSNCSSVSGCPEIAYHVTVAIPSVAASTHLNHARMKHVRSDSSMGWG